MKKTILILGIFLGSLVSEPLLASNESDVTLSTTESSFSRNPFVDKTSSKRFKNSSRKARRGKKTCMKKGGCSGKSRGLFKNKRGKCGRYY